MKLSALLPLCIRGSYDIDDLGRTEILFKSLSVFAEPNLFDEFLIVCPDNEVDIVKEKCTKWKKLNIRVISEEELVPELKSYPNVRGWRKQQMVKLAAPRMLDCDYFVTFDADVICLKPLTKEILLPKRKAILQYEMRSRHPKWWRSSSRILNMSTNTYNSKKGMTVTPAILSSKLCLLTGEEIEKHWNRKGTWVDRLCQLHNPKSVINWTPYRFKRAKWTEYSLYYLCTLKHNLFDKYHVSTGTNETPQLMLSHDTSDYEEWNESKSFSQADPHLFCVVGSKKRLETESVWERIKPFIPYSEIE
ncbi:DUF6492 family protein [Labilibaculum manganireducens]|uniref:DUF6492 family protein n=1 Tax=Labilibaculum manganireducens TaxID=1940525 RepID=UPI0029F4A898|nr:DUF6492 family protein [Labilibaculum manganireducens]